MLSDSVRVFILTFDGAFDGDGFGVAGSV